MLIFLQSNEKQGHFLEKNLCPLLLFYKGFPLPTVCPSRTGYVFLQLQRTPKSHNRRWGFFSTHEKSTGNLGKLLGQLSYVYYQQFRLLQSCGTTISTLVSLITVGEDNMHQSSCTGSQIIFTHISLSKASHSVLSPLEGYKEVQSSHMPRREGMEKWVSSTNG